MGAEPSTLTEFQSTLPRGERLQTLSPVPPVLYFNPRSHEGSDFRRLLICYRRLYFNPRSHEGSDLAAYAAATGGLQISIHAPTRGATTQQISFVTDNQTFQSTLPRGERRLSCIPCSPLFYFNPRSHEGSDTLHLVQTQHRKYFNPRSHEGSDIPFVSLNLSGKISIHAPTRGATPVSGFSCIS